MKKLILLLVSILPSLFYTSPLFPIAILFSQESWKCKQTSCNKEFLTFSDFYTHSTPHIEEAMGSCWLCKKTFPKKTCNFVSHIYRTHYDIPPCPLRKKPVPKNASSLPRFVKKNLGFEALCEFPLTPNHIQTHHEDFVSPYYPAFFSCNLCETLIPLQDLKLIFQHYHIDVNSYQYKNNSKNWTSPLKYELNIKDTWRFENQDALDIKAALILMLI